MKKLLRVLVLVLANLLTLHMQLAILAVLLVSERSDEENAYIHKYTGMIVSSMTKWIQTGKLIQEEESE